MNMLRICRKAVIVSSAIVAFGHSGAFAQKPASPSETLKMQREPGRVESGRKFFGDARYAGSERCKSCHEQEFKDWKGTWHAKMERWPSPDIIVGDFNDRRIQYRDIRVRGKDGKEQSISPSALAFRKGDKFFFTLLDADSSGNDQTYEIGKVLGGNWDQGYEVRFGDNFIPAPLRWSVAQNDWLTGGFNVQDWFTPDGTADGRPNKPEEMPRNRVADAKCNGCHTTGFESVRDKVSGVWMSRGKGEIGIGCESCHGPGSAHLTEAEAAKSAGKALAAGTTTIIHPVKDLDPEQGAQLCGQCHGRGTNKKEPDLAFPNGFMPGDRDLTSRLRLWSHSGASSPAEAEYFWSNDWASRNRQQWQDHTKSAHYTKGGMSCTTCHVFHGKAEYGQLRKKPADLCADCHTGSGRAKMPNVEMFEGSAMQESGVTCSDCHMARLGSRSRRTAKSGHQWDTSAHTMLVSSPLLERTRGIRSSCTDCHGGKPGSRGKVMPSGEQAKAYTLDEMNDRASRRAATIIAAIDEAQKLLASVKSKRSEAAALVDKANSSINFVLLDNSKGAHNYLRAKKLLDEANRLAADAAAMN